MIPIITDALLGTFVDTEGDGFVALIDDIVEAIALVALLVYTFLSYLSVYRQRRRTTILKLIGTGMVYLLILGVTISVVAVIALIEFF